MTHRDREFLELYRAHQGAVFRFCLHLSGAEDVANEVTQEVFLALLEKPAAFDPRRGSWEGYLLGVARNLMRRRFRVRPEVELDESWPEPEAHGGLLAGLTREQAIDAVRQAVASLPFGYREAVVLCDLEEQSYEQAAQILGCPVGTVRSRLFRGRGLLAAKLKPYAGSAV